MWDCCALLYGLEDQPCTPSQSSDGAAQPLSSCFCVGSGAEMVFCPPVYLLLCSIARLDCCCTVWENTLQQSCTDQ